MIRQLTRILCFIPALYSFYFMYWDFHLFFLLPLGHRDPAFWKGFESIACMGLANVMLSAWIGYYKPNAR